MNQTEYHLKVVINLRSGAVPSQYTSISSFRISGSWSAFKSRMKFCCSQNSWCKQHGSRPYKILS